MEVGLEVPAGSLDYWGERLEQLRRAHSGRRRRDSANAVLAVRRSARPAASRWSRAQRPRVAFTPWDGSPVPAERQIRGLYGAQVWERDAASTATFLTSVLGFRAARDRGRLDALRLQATPPASSTCENALEARRGAWGVGSVHHLAWRVDDEAHQRAVRAQVDAAGAQPTPVIDRFWFKSVYFKEPGGVLFELATDGPGFAVDEEPAHLGETLVLPPWLEAQRAAIERALPPLTFASPAHAKS